MKKFGLYGRILWGLQVCICEAFSSDSNQDPSDTRPLDYINDKTKCTNVYSDRTDTLIKKVHPYFPVQYLLTHNFLQCQELSQTAGAYVAFICAR